MIKSIVLNMEQKELNIKQLNPLIEQLEKLLPEGDTSLGFKYTAIDEKEYKWTERNFLFKSDVHATPQGLIQYGFDLCKIAYSGKEDEEHTIDTPIIPFDSCQPAPNKIIICKPRPIRDHETERWYHNYGCLLFILIIGLMTLGFINTN